MRDEFGLGGGGAAVDYGAWLGLRAGSVADAAVAEVGSHPRRGPRARAMVRESRHHQGILSAPGRLVRLDARRRGLRLRLRADAGAASRAGHDAVEFSEARGAVIHRGCPERRVDGFRPCRLTSIDRCGTPSEGQPKAKATENGLDRRIAHDSQCAPRRPLAHHPANMHSLQQRKTTPRHHAMRPRQRPWPASRHYRRPEHRPDPSKVHPRRSHENHPAAARRPRCACDSRIPASPRRPTPHSIG